MIFSKDEWPDLTPLVALDAGFFHHYFRMTSESSQFSASAKSGSYLASRISMIISNQHCQPDPVRVLPQHKAPGRKLQFTSAWFGLSIFVIDQVFSKAIQIYDLCFQLFPVVPEGLLNY